MKLVEIGVNRALDCNGDKGILICSRFGGLNDSFKVRLVYFFII